VTDSIASYKDELDGIARAVWPEKASIGFSYTVAEITDEIRRLKNAEFELGKELRLLVQRYPR
jgi:hypothetical protein